MKYRFNLLSLEQAMSFGYSVSQLLKYHRHVKAAVKAGEGDVARVAPPGGRAGWDCMTCSAWLRWFGNCLTLKIGSKMPATGKGNKAKRRAEREADAKKECKWCGQKTGSRNRDFCCGECRRDYYC